MVLRQCDHAGCQREPDGSKLRRCAACSGVMYCSKECQKAAWPVHKVYCQRALEKSDALTSHNPEAKRFGYDSTVALNQAMHEYTEAHQWAIQTTILAHTLLRSGSDMSVARQEPRKDVFRFRLVCQTTPGTPRSQRNPANTFRVVEHGFSPLAHYDWRPAQNRQLRDEMLRDSQASHEDYLKEDNPFYVGILPIMYLFDDVSIMQFTIFPVYRPPNNIEMERGVKAVLSELIRYNVYTLGTAFPLRAACDRLPYYAIPGQFVREKGRQWMWEALFYDWDDYNEGRADCGRLPGLEELCLGLPPAALMDLYSMLFAMKTTIIERLGLRSLRSI